MTPAQDPKQGNRKSIGKKNEFSNFSDFPVFCYFGIENGVSEGREVLKKLPGSVALRCDRISCRGEPWGPDS